MSSDTQNPQAEADSRNTLHREDIDLTAVNKLALNSIERLAAAILGELALQHHLNLHDIQGDRQTGMWQVYVTIRDALHSSLRHVDLIEIQRIVDEE